MNQRRTEETELQRTTTIYNVQCIINNKDEIPRQRHSGMTYMATIHNLQLRFYDFFEVHFGTFKGRIDQIFF